MSLPTAAIFHGLMPALLLVACEGTAPSVPSPQVSPLPDAAQAQTNSPDVAAAVPRAETGSVAAPQAAAAPEKVAAPSSPWGTAQKPSAIAEVLLDWADQAELHGISLPHARQALEAALGTATAAESFESNLSALVASLPARPRTVSYLVDEEHGYYHSPDAFWLEPSAADPASPAVSDRLATARPFIASGDAAGLRSFIDGLIPHHPQYRALVAARQRYQQICATGGWEPIAMPKNKRVTPELEAAIAMRLGTEGFVVGEEALVDSVRRYREARHLPVIRRYIDEELLDALNIPCTARLDTLAINVKRWRHSAMSPDDEAQVAVNLAAQELVFRVRGDERVRSRTVVGSSRSMFSTTLKRRVFRNATPILADRISKVIVNPEWNVPGRIAREEIEPAIAKDPDYLTKNHFRVVDTATGGKIYVQTPGDHNALGRMKILFPNNEGVYLHDTPAKGKFQLPVRAASHGCVRVEKVFDLGVALLNYNREKDPANANREPLNVWNIKHMFHRNKQLPFNLEHTVPVYFEYYTASVAVVEGHEVVRFHPDIYMYDSDSLAALASRSVAPVNQP